MNLVRLESSWLTVSVSPDAGGKVWELVPRATGRNVLWQHPTRSFAGAGGQAVGNGSVFEDVWTGGWDELFPNDSPCRLDGQLLPDHGEWWSRPWEHRRLDGARGLYLRLESETAPVRAEKWIQLAPDRPVMRTTYRLQNRSARRVPFLWAQHPALAISPNHRIDLPPCRLLPDRSQPGRQRPVPKEFRWPGPAGGPDLRVVVPPTDLLEGYFATDLAEGWCALTDTVGRTGVGFAFAPDLFRSLWLWLSYGGWRGQYVALLEPSTGYPSALTEAMARGTCSWLEPGATMETEFVALCYDGMRRVDRIDLDGSVHGA